MKKKRAEDRKKRYPKVVETFSEPWNFHVAMEPSSFNGIISIRKYRITVEMVDEPKEVLAERLLALWRKCDNHHERWPLATAAKELGAELPGDEFGVERAKRFEKGSAP